MPLVTIVAVPPPDSGAARMLADVVEAAAAALSRDPADVSARFVAAAAAVTGTDVETAADQNPTVTVTTRAQPPETVERTLKAVAAAVASALSIEPGRVWARWDTLQPGTVLADGAMS